MNAKELYQLSDVRKTLSASFALHLSRLDVPRGAVLALLGPTGAGKSTLLRLLAGLDDPTSGEILFDTAAFGSRRLPLPTRRQIAMVHQRPLLVTGDVRLNVGLGLQLRGDRNTTRKVDKILNRLRLSAIAAQSSHSLSGGQVQLVALARALVVEPQVLLLDEPTAHLDPVHVAVVEDTVGQLQQERGTTVLWATHNLFQARRVATHTALLWDGHLVETASTSEFFANPKDARTVDFVQGRAVY